VNVKKYSIIVIGAGAGGLVIAKGAAKAGKKVLLIEKAHYGGDCTNFGCIPSKSLIASADVAFALRKAKTYGIELNSFSFDATQVLERVRCIVEKVKTTEDPAALSKEGIETITGIAEFIDPHILKVNNLFVSAKKIVIATGSYPFIPSIEGLNETPFLTNETIFLLNSIPKRLIVMGAGPIGCELAQAFSRLGSQVTLIHSHDELLNKEDPIAAQCIQKQFEKEGIKLFLGLRAHKVEFKEQEFFLSFSDPQIALIKADQLLVAVGRRPNVNDLKLEAAKVHYTEKGIPVDVYGRTNQPHIYGVGDVTGGPLFTHAAENQARSVLTSLLLLPFKKKLDKRQPVPRVTYTDPELASVGLSEQDTLKRYHPSKIAVYYVPLSENDRALTADRTEGFVKIITKKWSSKILGATIVAPRAGEMLCQITTAIHGNIPLRKLASLIHPYPTYSLAIRKAADLWLKQTILPIFMKKRKKL